METIETSVKFPMGSARFRILEKIKELGYEAQNQQLLQLGLTKYSQNLRYLKEYNGNFEIVSSKLIERKSLKDKKKDQVEVGEKDEGNKQRRNRLNKEKLSKEPRAKKERLPQITLNEYTEWPSHIETVYLDGNNMLFVEDAIRKKVLGKRKKAGEKMLAELAMQFSKLGASFNVVLIFDSTKLTYSQNIEVDGKTLKFDVVSATPNYSNSDDALVDWSSGLGDKRANCLFVTSDRGLQVRLSQNGIENIMKPKKWFSFVKTQIGDENYQNILNKDEENH